MRRFFLLILILAAIAAVLLAPSYLRYRQTRGAAPPAVRLGGLNFGSASAAEVTAVLARRFSEPVAIFYGDERILLRPAMVSLEVDTAAMLAEARTYENPGHLVRVWIGEALGWPVAPAEVPLRYQLDREALDSWLTDVARRYDRATQPSRTDAAARTILPGQSGRQLDLPASRQRVIAALVDPGVRSANLAVLETAPQPLRMALLEELLRVRAATFPGIVGIFLHHVPTGDEAALNADVAFSGMSTVKIAILTELYRTLPAPPDVSTTRLITETVALAGNRSANELLAVIGGGDAPRGAQTLTTSLRRLGLRNTYMAAPYDQYAPRIPTPANSRTDLVTQPDPAVQTTPRDMGLLLEMLLACRTGGGTLLAAYGEQITPEECAQLLDLMKLNDVTDLIVAGLPAGTPAIHKHGYLGATHGNVAAIWGPAGPYVLSIFLYSPPWLAWDVSSQAMAELSRATWDYFTLAARQ